MAAGIMMNENLELCTMKDHETNPSHRLFIWFRFSVLLFRSDVGCAAVFHCGAGSGVIGERFLAIFSFVVDFHIGVVFSIGGAVCRLRLEATIGGRQEATVLKGPQIDRDRWRELLGWKQCLWFYASLQITSPTRLWSPWACYLLIWD